MYRFTPVITVFLVALTLVGCSQMSEEEQVTKSQQLIAASNYAEAIIVLKDVVVNNKNNDDARSLLAEAYFKNGEFVQAEKELYRVESLRKLTAGELEQLLLTLYFQQDASQIPSIELGDDATDLSRVLQAFVLFSSTGQYNEVISPVLNELASNDGRLLLAGLTSYSLLKFDEAIDNFSQVTNKENYFPFINVMQGLAQVQIGQNDAAVEQYDLVLKSSANFDLIKLYKSEALIQMQKYEDAKVILTKLATKYTEQPVIKKLISVINYSEEDYVNAKKNAELAITLGLSDATVRGIAAVSSMSIGNYEAAYQHFQMIESEVQQIPSFNAAYLYTKLKLGYESEVAETLLRSNESLGAFPQITAITIENLLSTKQTEMADRLAQFVIAQGASGDSNIANALVKLGNENAIATLEKELESAPNKDSLYTLASYYFNNNEFEKAKQLSIQYLKSEPESLLALTTLMLSHANLEQAEDARKIANRIQSTHKNEAISANLIAMQQFQNNEIDASLKTLASALNENKLNISLLKSARTVNLQLGKPENSLPYFQAAYEQNGDSAYKFWYAQALADARMDTKVIALLNNHNFTAQTPRAIWVFLSDAYANTNQNKRAVELLHFWVKQKPNDAFAYVKLLSQPETKNVVPNIYAVVKEGLLRFKGNDLYSLLAVQYAIDRGDQIVANEILTGISPEIKKSPLYNNQYGRYLLLVKNYQEALPYLKKAYEAQPSFFHLSQINNAYLGLLEVQNALDIIDNHLKTTPDDTLAKMLKADVLIWTNPDAAIAEYQLLLKEYPKNALAMNNIAWLHLQAGDIEQARNFAQQAVDLFPKEPNFLDTLAQTYIIEKNYLAAKSLLEIAIKNKPSDLTIYFNYADTLFGLGQRANASNVLKNINTNDEKLKKEIQTRLKTYQ